jgi:phosphatidylglycerophosphate synthase
MLDSLSRRFPQLRSSILKPFIFKTDPNYITLLALVVAVLAGMAFASGRWILGAILVLLNGFLDILDGEIARKYGATKLGDFLDHATDRIADVAIIGGLALAPGSPIIIGFAAIVAVLLVSYLGTEAQALTRKRLYAGMLGRADRLVIIIVAGLLQIVWNSAAYWALLIILALSAITFFQRFWILYRQF